MSPLRITAPWLVLLPQTGSDRQGVQAGTGSFQIGSRGAAKAVSFARDKYLSVSENDPGCSSIPRKAFSLLFNTTSLPSAPSTPPAPSVLRLLLFCGGQSGGAERAASFVNRSSTHFPASERPCGVNPIPALSCIPHTLVLSVTKWKTHPFPPPASNPQSSPGLLLQTPNQIIWRGGGATDSRKAGPIVIPPDLDGEANKLSLSAISMAQSHCPQVSLPLPKSPL